MLPPKLPPELPEEPEEDPPDELEEATSLMANALKELVLNTNKLFNKSWEVFEKEETSTNSERQESLETEKLSHLNNLKSDSEEKDKPPYEITIWASSKSKEVFTAKATIESTTETFFIVINLLSLLEELNLKKVVLKNELLEVKLNITLTDLLGIKEENCEAEILSLEINEFET